MNCGQFEARLNLVLDQRRSPADDDALAAHAAVCADCDRLLVDESLLVACLAETSPCQPSYGFANRVVSAASAAHVHQRRSNRVWLALGVAMAAAAAMLLAISIVWQARQASPNGVQPIAANSEFTEADLSRISGQLLSLTMPGGRELSLEEMEKYAPAFRPLRESLALIWDTLRRAISTGHDPNPPPAEERALRWEANPIRVVGTVRRIHVGCVEHATSPDRCVPQAISRYAIRAESKSCLRA
jgi:hypothetical protein